MLASTWILIVTIVCSARELSDEEKKVLMMTEDFHQFFDRSTRLVERALHEEDIFLDYSHDNEDESGR